VVNDVLGAAYAEGRLSAEELDERTDQVARSKTLGELPAIVHDLVVTSPASYVRSGGFRAEAESRYRHQRQQAFWGFLTPTLICWAIWAMTMWGGFPWPVIVTVASGARFAQLLANPRDSIESIERDLERRELRRIARGRRRQLRGRPPEEWPPAPHR
jgi:hypothetical protein